MTFPEWVISQTGFICISHTSLNAITLISTQDNMEIQVSERNVTIEINSSIISYIIVNYLWHTYQMIPIDYTWELLYTVLKQLFFPSHKYYSTDKIFLYTNVVGEIKKARGNWTNI